MKGIDTMAEKKLTKVEMFNKIKANLHNQDEIDFINHEIELLQKKSSQAKKPTAQQIENENFTSIIKEVLQASEEALTISEIQERDNRLPASNQRMSRLLNNLVESNILEKTYLKRKPYFKWVG